MARGDRDGRGNGRGRGGERWPDTIVITCARGGGERPAKTRSVEAGAERRHSRSPVELYRWEVRRWEIHTRVLGDFATGDHHCLERCRR